MMTTDWIRKHRDDLIDFVMELVATPSPNLPGDERAVAKAITAHLRRLDMDGFEIAAKEPHRPNVIYRLAGRGDGPTLMLCGHSDTKPVGDGEQWRSDPMKPVIRDGKMYGLGTTDMKGAVAAMIYAVAALKQTDAPLHGDVLLVVNADEERTMTCGSEFLATDYGIKADVCLLGEPSGIDGPEFEFLHLLSRGLSCFTVRVLGTQMHSSLSDRMPSVNASIVMGEVLHRLDRELKLTFEPHPLCASPTTNLGVRIEGGVGYGVYPGSAAFQSDIRTLPGMSRDQLERDLRSCLESISRDYPKARIDLTFEEPPLDWFAPSQVEADHPLVGALLDAAQQVLGRRPELSAFPGGTDAKNFQVEAGIPTIPSFGPGWLPLAHGPNECVGVEAIVQAAQMYAIAAMSYLRA